MQGPFRLDPKTVESKVKSRPGVFILGNNIHGTFVAKLTGKTSSDLNAALKAVIGRFDSFYYEHANDPGDAYQKECMYYHSYTDKGYRLENEGHPEKPEGYDDVRCLQCGK